MPDEIIPDDLEIIAVIDKEKLPENIRKILDDKLPKDLQEEVFKKLEKPIHNKQDNPTDSSESKENKLFAIQTGTVVGNIYDKNFKL